MNKNDLTIIALIILIASITAWNSRYSLIPAPTGYARFTKHGISFLYPDYLDPWEVAINDDGTTTQGGSRMISFDWGCAGWNSGNTDVERPEREGYFRESSLLWLSTDPQTGDGATPHMFYAAMEANAVVRNREQNMTLGETGVTTHRGHDVRYQYHNYSIRDYGAEHSHVVYGIVGAFYCPQSGRTMELYYLDIYDFDPVYDRESLFDSFRFYLDSVRCH
jgi:hypothetical protein